MVLVVNEISLRPKLSSPRDLFLETRGVTESNIGYNFCEYRKGGRWIVPSLAHNSQLFPGYWTSVLRTGYKEHYTENTEENTKHREQNNENITQQHTGNNTEKTEPRR